MYLAMGQEQAEKENRAIVLRPSFPDSSRIYLYEMDELPEKLCISKTIGWEKEICIRKEDIPQVLERWYPNGVGDWKWMELIGQIEGEYVWIVGFGD